MLVDFNVASFFFQSYKLAGRQTCYIFTRHKGCTKRSREDFSGHKNEKGRIASFCNNNRDVEAANFYSFILKKKVTSCVLITVNMYIHGVLGHADLPEDASS